MLSNLRRAKSFPLLTLVSKTERNKKQLSTESHSRFNKIVKSLAYSMSGDDCNDQLRIAFLCNIFRTHKKCLANSFPLTLAPNTSMCFNLSTSLPLKCLENSVPIQQLASNTLATARSEDRCLKVRGFMDKYDYVVTKLIWGPIFLAFHSASNLLKKEKEKRKDLLFLFHCSTSSPVRGGPKKERKKE